MLITTRVPAVAGVAITFLRRKHLRPLLLKVLSVVLPTVGVLAFVSFLGTLRDAQHAANLFVLACIAVQIFYA